MFLTPYFLMVTNLNFLITDSEEIRKEVRIMIERQFEHDMCDKFFSNQLKSDDEVDTLEPRMQWWLAVVDRLGVITDDVFDYTCDELYMICRKT